MMSFLACITGFFMNFEILPILLKFELILTYTKAAMPMDN
jgi:hypothetical protein